MEGDFMSLWKKIFGQTNDKTSEINISVQTVPAQTRGSDLSLLPFNENIVSYLKESGTVEYSFDNGTMARIYLKTNVFKPFTINDYNGFQEIENAEKIFYNSKELELLLDNLSKII